MASVTVSDLNKQFGATRVLKGVSLRIPEGAFAVLVGPSGCGKSTLLRLLAGLEQADSGVIRFGDRDVTRLEPRERDIAMVFQSYALYPHLSVRDNLAFGLKLRKADPDEIRRRVDEAAAMLGLGPLLDRLPKMLSGGQRQRVAMGRAIVRRPQLFLFDEPLSNLDAALRSQVRVDIRKLHDSLGATSVYVTHDQVEAMTLADVIFVLNKGVVEQAGQPLDIYARPATRFVAGFMGMPAMNFFDGTLERGAGGFTVTSGDVKVAVDAARFGDVLREAGAEGRRVTVGVRPHDVRLVPEGQGAPMEVTIVEALGMESFAHGSLAGAPFVARFEADAAVKKRDRIHLAFATAHLFDAESGVSLRAGDHDGGSPQNPPAQGRSVKPALLAVLVLLFTLVAPARARAAPGEGGRPTIRLWHAYRDDELKALEAVLSLWKGQTIEPVSIPFDAYQSKVAASVPLGEGPDLFIEEHKLLGDYRHRKVVAPVGDALEPGVFSEPALAAVTEGGEAWAVPLSQKCAALYVNTDLVKEIPPDLESFAGLGGLPAGVYPLAFEAKNTYYVAALLSAFGGELLTPDDQFGLFGPAAERALSLDRWLVEKRVIPEDADGDLVTKLFASGKAAFVISGPWLAASLNGKGIHYRVAKLPVVRASGQPMRPLLGVESVMLTPAGAQRPEVRALARLLASAEAAAIRARYGPTPSARRDIVLPPGDVSTFAEQALTAIPMPSSRAMQSVWDPANRAVLKVLHREASAETALAEAKGRFDNVRRSLPPPASPAPILFVVGALALWAAFRAVQAARAPGFGAEVRRSLPAYAYVAHAVLAVGVLVLLPLCIGAATSLFAGSEEERRYVGLANFVNILTARGGPLLTSGSFYLVLLVTLLWTVANLSFHVGIGLTLGLLLSRPTLRLKPVYRVLLILPWAVPSYVTALMWKGMFHRQFGALTALTLAVNHAFGTNLEPIAWFSRFSTAFAANLATNVWLGFPFMMVVTLGALTAVPEDVIEAAKVDGATRWQRLWLVTLPMIRPTLMPSITLGAIWTFNMFNVVFLVSGGDPDGTTDILISEAYRWAFTRQNQYGYAAAYAVLIFLLLSGFTRLKDRAQAKAAVTEAPA